MALFGALYIAIIDPLLSLLVIRQYPKYPKLRRLLLNSEYYFVDSNHRQSTGRYRDRLLFDIIATIIEKKKSKMLRLNYTIFRVLKLQRLHKNSVHVSARNFFTTGIQFMELSKNTCPMTLYLLILLCLCSLTAKSVILSALLVLFAILCSGCAGISVEQAA